MQSLIAAKRVASQSLRPMMIARVPSMSFAGKPLGDKERGDEKVFFNKEDEKVLKNLLKKMQTQAKQGEATPAEAEKSTANLKKLFKTHKLDETANKEFFDALLEWKKQL